MKVDISRSLIIIIVVFILIFFGIWFMSVQASTLSFSVWKATSGSFESSSVSTFYSGDTVYAWVQFVNTGNEKIRLQAAFYRIHPNAIEMLIQIKEQEINPSQIINFLIESWNIPGDAIIGFYGYRISYSIYRVSDGALIESGVVSKNNLYEVSTLASPANRLEIQFLDVQHNPISNATVYIDDNFRGYTDVNGYLIIEGISAAKHTIKIFKVGYNEKTQTVDVESGKINFVRIYHMEPEAPTLKDPVEGCILYNNTLTFNWYPVATANEYRLQVSTTSSFSTLVLDVSALSTSYSTSLSDNIYYWRVRAKNNVGWSVWSTTSSFRITTKPINCTIYFHTNPSIPTISMGYILFGGKEFMDGRIGYYPSGTYSISAIAPSGYNFYSWSATDDITISNIYSSSTTAIVMGNGAITANFKPQITGNIPILMITKFPQISIYPNEEIEFEVTLSNIGGKYADAKLWFRYLPEGIDIIDSGGSKLVDMGKSAIYRVKLKANKTARVGSYFSQVTGDARDAQHNWYTFTIRVIGTETTSTTTPIGGAEAIHTTTIPQTKTTPGYEAIMGIIELFAIAFLRRKK